MSEAIGIEEMMELFAKQKAELEALKAKQSRPRAEVMVAGPGKSVKVPSGHCAIIVPLASKGQMTAKGEGKNLAVASTGGSATVKGYDGQHGSDGVITANVNLWQAPGS
jgi:hypothetical protein